MPPSPKFGLVECDHIMLRPSSLDEGVKAFKRLGFNVRLSLAPGSDNPQLAFLNPSVMPFNNAIVGGIRDENSIEYLELMVPNDPVGLHPCMNMLGDSEGLKSMVIRIESIEKFADAMRAEGRPVYDSLRDLGRDLFSEKALKEMGSYEAWEAALKGLLSPILPKTGNAPFFFNGYQIHIPIKDYFANYVKGFAFDKEPNPNTAQGFIGVFGMSHDVRGDAMRQGEIWEEDPVFRDDGTAVLKMGERFSLEIFDQKDSARLFPGIEFSSTKITPFMCGSRVKVQSLETLVGILNENDVSYIQAPGVVRVQPADACSMMIEFIEA